MWGWLPMLNVGLVTHAQCGAGTHAQCGAGYPSSMWGWLPKLNVGLVTQTHVGLVTHANVKLITLDLHSKLPYPFLQI